MNHGSFERIGFIQLIGGWVTLTTNFFHSGTRSLLRDSIFGNSLILVSLNGESSLHPPSKLLYRCLATTDLSVGLAAQLLYASVNFLDCWTVEAWRIYSASLATPYALNGTFLFTITLKRTYIIVAITWVSTLVASLCTIFDYRITVLFGRIVIPIYSFTSITSYTKIFCALTHHQAQIQAHSRQQPSQPSALNVVRYRKAVYSALWVQLALIVSYAPYHIVEIVLSHSKPYSFDSWVIREKTVVLIYFNSALNLFLWCWKISAVRRIVKQTIWQALSCPWALTRLESQPY